jgi:hypothetical protein
MKKPKNLQSPDDTPLSLTEDSALKWTPPETQSVISPPLLTLAGLTGSAGSGGVSSRTF